MSFSASTSGPAAASASRAACCFSRPVPPLSAYPSRSLRSSRSIGYSVKCIVALSTCVLLLLLALIAQSVQGFSVSRPHSRTGEAPGGHRRHHHPERDPDVTGVGGEVADPYFRDALESFGDVDSDGVPLFMKVLLHDTVDGFLFRDQTQPVPPPLPSAGGRQGVADDNLKSLASSVAPSRVSVDPAGMMLLEFPSVRRQDDRDAHAHVDADVGFWLVLGLQHRSLNVDPDDAVLTLAVYLTSAHHAGHPERLRLLVEQELPTDPNAAFVAVDVSKAVNHTHSALRFLVDVVGEGKGPVSAAAVLEVAGMDRGPLLVRSKERLSEDGPMRAWLEPPADLVNPPKERSRRSSRRRTSSTTTEGYTSAENPLRKAATAGISSTTVDNDNETENVENCPTCHLQEWEMSTKDLGWSFIVYPPTLPINFCSGVCPTPLLDNHYNMTSNAIARTNIKLLGTAAGVNIPEAVCTPIRYKPLAILIRKEGDVIEMVTNSDLCADRCGCR